MTTSSETPSSSAGVEPTFPSDNMEVAGEKGKSLIEQTLDRVGEQLIYQQTLSPDQVADQLLSPVRQTLGLSEGEPLNEDSAQALFLTLASIPFGPNLTEMMPDFDPENIPTIESTDDMVQVVELIFNNLPAEKRTAFLDNLLKQTASNVMERFSPRKKQEELVASVDAGLTERSTELERGIGEAASRALSELDQQTSGDQPVSPSPTPDENHPDKKYDLGISVTSSGAKATAAGELSKKSRVIASVEADPLSQSASLGYTRTGTLEAEAGISRSASGGISYATEVQFGHRSAEAPPPSPAVTSGIPGAPGAPGAIATHPHSVDVRVDPENRGIQIGGHFSDGQVSLFAGTAETSTGRTTGAGGSLRLTETRVGEIALSGSVEISTDSAESGPQLESVLLSASLVSADRENRYAISANADGVGLTYARQTEHLQAGVTANASFAQTDDLTEVGGQPRTNLAASGTVTLRF